MAGQRSYASGWVLGLLIRRSQQMADKQDYEQFNAPQEWRRFGRGASRFLGLLAAVWLVLSSFQRTFPYLASGAALVSQDKFYILAGTKLFGPGDRFKV